MPSVQQSGSVTPGHYATWTTAGVIQDGGSLLAAQKVLAAMFSANFNDTFDQPLILPPAITVFQLTGIIVTNASISLTTAQGGFYSAANKGGSAIVSSAQAYSALTGPDLLMQPTLTSFAQTARLSANNLPLLQNANGQYGLTVYLSLTTGQGFPATADVYLIGIDLTP
jgi:hypothetical protein